MASKQKKKRNKKYSGADAKVTSPHVLRVSAEERSAFREWWLSYGQLVRVGAIVAAILVMVIIVIIGIIGLFQR